MIYIVVCFDLLGFKRFYKKAHMKTLAHKTVEQIWNFIVKNLSTDDLSLFIKTPSRLLHNAARAGNAEFLIILISSYPDLIWKVDDDKKSIFHVAVENRQESVFSLMYEIGGLRDFLANYHDPKKNSNMLHLAGKLAAPYHLSIVSGAALQMQRELLWFKVRRLLHRFKLEEQYLNTLVIYNLIFLYPLA